MKQSNQQHANAKEAMPKQMYEAIDFSELWHWFRLEEENIGMHYGIHNSDQIFLGKQEELKLS